MKLGDPITGVAKAKFTRGARIRSVIINCVAPVRCIPVGEVVVAKGAEIIPLGTEVVVDNVENHAQAEPMGRVDEPAEGVGVAVVVRRRVPINSVIAPIPPSGKFCYRQHFQESDADTPKFLQLLDSGVKGAFLSKGTDV